MVEFEIYLPCEPEWVCGPLLFFFGVLFSAGIISFIWLIFKESRRIQRKQRVLKRRRQHYSLRDKRHGLPDKKKK
ncbi:hypothetical protein [Vibrio quintilis]|uniref:Uncharacterized protein n=1 Tax=Vibrio quintilis TaxID=1117707 RepID=A0A1M7YUA9_9VIBR|nr:hypothetical protein [Vibrio quintilis]SHO56158.1 hypothetical protein VQ7734_01925 [Vibrio quintilis]